MQKKKKFSRDDEPNYSLGDKGRNAPFAECVV